MPPRITTLVADLDGTLLSRDGSVTEVNRHAVQRLRDAGVELVIATGRALVESQAALVAIGHDGLFIGAGGSLLSEASTGRTLRRSAMSPGLVAEATQVLLDAHHKVLILKDADAVGYDYLAVGPAELDPASQWWFETLPVRVRFVHDLKDDPHPDDSVRMGAVASEGELAPLAAQLREQLGDRAFLQHWAAVTESAATNSSTHLLEVFQPRVSKWTMLAEHFAALGRDTAQVAAVGDGINDVEMIERAPLGIAMANADASVLRVANLVVGHHDEDGFAEAVAHVLEGVVVAG
jgi:HAD superfamily hydrolase (TIGR01484 family)